MDKNLDHPNEEDLRQRLKNIKNGRDTLKYEALASLLHLDEKVFQKWRSGTKSDVACCHAVRSWLKNPKGPFTPLPDDQFFPYAHYVDVIFRQFKTPSDEPLALGRTNFVLLFVGPHKPLEDPIPPVECMGFDSIQEAKEAAMNDMRVWIFKIVPYKRNSKDATESKKKADCDAPQNYVEPGFYLSGSAEIPTLNQANKIDCGNRKFLVDTGSDESCLNFDQLKLQLHRSNKVQLVKINHERLIAFGVTVTILNSSFDVMATHDEHNIVGIDIIKYFDLFCSHRPDHKLLLSQQRSYSCSKLSQFRNSDLRSCNFAALLTMPAALVKWVIENVPKNIKIAILGTHRLLGHAKTPIVMGCNGTDDSTRVVEITVPVDRTLKYKIMQLPTSEKDAWNDIERWTDLEVSLPANLCRLTLHGVWPHGDISEKESQVVN